MQIALDAFGSDNAPFPEVEGAILAIKEEVCSKVILVGNQDELNSSLAKFYYDKNRIKIVHAHEKITMTDAPAKVVKQKNDSSLVKAIKLHKDGIVDATVSAGSTGAVMTASLFIYGRINNVLRPAIAITLPTQKHPEIILDVGANVDCSADNLVQFAKMGSLYSHFFYKNPNPKVALLNIGEEDAKGNEVVRKAFNKLKKYTDINFVGNIEGEELLKGVVDVVVCDGFVGNVMLKTVEGAAISIFSMMKEQIKKDWVAKIGALLSFPVYSYLKKKMDHSEYGGALLVGLDGITVISHGKANAIAIKNAIKFAARIAKSGFIEHTRDYYEGKLK